MIKGGRYFLIFQHNDMLNLCLNMNESKPVYAYKYNICVTKAVIAFLTNTNNFASLLHYPTLALVEMQTFLLMKNWLSVFQNLLKVHPHF